MYINMTPDKTNKTLHASQDDTTRQFKFKLVSDSQVLDTSDSIPPVIYDVEPDGIEQLLPVNSSTPTTTPIIADIQYPDELRENQEFFDRITPTTLKGQAKIEKIKGNTLVFNQLVQNGNFADTSNWLTSNSSISVSNNEATITFNQQWASVRSNCNLVYNHKYYVKADIKMDTTGNTRIGLGDAGYMSRQGVYLQFNPSDANYHTYEIYGTLNEVTGASDKSIVIQNSDNSSRTGYIKNVIVIDLTLMFGSGNEPTSVSDFETWLSNNIGLLPYYDYNAGSLLSFNGTGIKSVGFNQWDEEWEVGSIDGNGDNSVNNSVIRSKNYIRVLGGNTLYFFIPKPIVVHKYAGDYSYLGNNYLSGSTTYVLPSECQYIRFRTDTSYGTTYNNDICVNYSSSEDGTYKPYTENTIDLPTSTYFPTGMKSAGTVYDELTESKAITRIGAVDMGTLTWTYDSANNRFKSNAISDILPPSSASVSANAVCGKYPVLSYTSSVATDKTMTVIFQGSAAVGQLWVHDSSFTSASAFASAMSGVYLYYEFATPTEEDIESCSLVSEDIEIPLEYDSGFLVCDSNGLTSKAGFIPCKVKMAKEDEILYSQLINLHVERKP